MTEKYHILSDDLTNHHRMTELQYQTGYWKNGIDCLKEVDTLSVKQIPSLTEAVFGVASEAKFDIFNKNGQRILQALETSSFWQRLCCTSNRQFTLRIIDNTNQDIMCIRREFKCCAGCCWCANMACCSHEIMVESPPNTVIGSVSQLQSCCRPRYALKDVNDTPTLFVVGPGCACDGVLSCLCQPRYVLFGNDETTEIGSIRKIYRGFLAEAFTSADAYTLEFPIDLDVKMKAVALGALLLIDFASFSTVSQNDNTLYS